MPTILRSRCAPVAVFVLCCAFAGMPGQSQAGVFLDMNFNNEVLGEPIQTTSPLTESPELHAYSTGGFPDVGAYNGTNTVVNDGNFSNAVRMFTNQGATGANFIDTQFAVISADIVTLDFDLRIVDQSNVVYPQATAHAPLGQLFAINAYAWNTPSRVFRFIAAPTSETSGIFGMRDNAGGDIIEIGAYTVGTDYHVSIFANYLTGTVDASVSGVGTRTGLSFVDSWPGTYGMSEFFIFQNNVAGERNEILLDNIVGATAAVVPEPSSLAIFALGSLCCCVGLARRRERSAVVR